MYMSTKGSTRLANKQVVVMRIGRQILVGKVCNIKPVGKTYLYDVAGEDGKIYYEMYVDQDINHTIDTKLTKKFCDKYEIQSDMVSPPISEIEESEFNSSIEELVDTGIDEVRYDDEGILFEFNEDE